VKAIVLAAGYATRLRPLTDRIAKELLPVGGRPMIDWILEALAAVPLLGDVHVVTNARKAADFERWAAAREVTIHDDGTTSNDDRLGAIGDIAFVLEQIGDEDDLLVIAGDNLFELDLADLVRFWSDRPGSSALAVHDVGSLELARSFGVVELDADDRLVGFIEKPERPASTLIATATYLYSREHVPLLATYLADGNPPDQPGRFVDWLHRREPVYGYRFDGAWFDIGSPEQLLEADNWLRRREQLPERAAYSVD
jgi:glucose-1-phosphate thymidylyltransferase